MVIFLDIEHPKALEDEAYRNERVKTMEMRRSLFAELAGEDCVTRHYREFQASELDRPEVSSLVTSGNRSLWEDYDIPSEFSEFKRAIESSSKPVLGICGGHQLISLVLGGEASPIRRLEDHEDDVYPGYAPGWLKEWGYYRLQFDPKDPLFRGFDKPFEVTQRHFWHINLLPEGFHSIAYNANCPVQAMRNAERPLYGVQFHPEFHDASHLDGRRILENFFALCK